MKFIALLLLTSFAAARCSDRTWAVDDDRIDGFVSVERKPLKHAKVHLSSPAQEYSAITDEKGAFLLRGVGVGKYAFVVKGWGEAHLEVRGWHRGGNQSSCPPVFLDEKMSNTHDGGQLIIPDLLSQCKGTLNRIPTQVS